MKKLETLSFKKFCMSIGNLPSSYVESLSYYECIMWLCKFLEEQVIPTVNNNSEAVTELQQLFIQLKNYVDTYFDNLDVQEEVNAKLDEMVEDGTLEELIGDYVFNRKVDYYLIDNTWEQEDIQALMNRERAKIIEFTDGEYEFDSTFYLNSDTKLILNNAVLTFTEQHSFFNFLPTDEPLAYGGNSNIEIIGGKIVGGSFSICHGYNIKFNHVEFENSLNSHIIEIMSCDNVKIIDCKFAGQTDTLTTYREYIQIDDTTYSNFPWFDDENNPTYDGTMCKNILVDGCYFGRTTNENFVFHTAFGMHTITESGLHHENITLINNTIVNPSSHGFRINNTVGVKISNNNFYSIDTYNTNLIVFRFGYYAKNVEISNNTVDGGYRAMYFSKHPLSYNNFNISNNVFKNMSSVDHPSYALIILNDPTEFRICNNLFLNNGRSAMAINGTEVEDSETANVENIATIIINGNTFYDTIVNKNMIQIYYGTQVFVNNNYFEYDTSTGGSAILSDNNTKCFMSGNVFSNELVGKARTINMQTNTDVNDIYDHKINIYSANASSFTDVVVPNVSIFQFNALDLVIGGTTDTVVVKLKPYSMKGKLTARTYKIAIANASGEYECVTFTINNDGTISGSSTSLNIRSIWAYNEVSV